MRSKFVFFSLACLLCMSLLVGCNDPDQVDASGSSSFELRPDVVSLDVHRAVVVDVLNNDIYKDKQGIKLISAQVLSGAAEVFIVDGEVRVEPALSFSGEVRVAYVASDGVTEASSTLVVNVPPVMSLAPFNLTSITSDMPGKLSFEWDGLSDDILFTVCRHDPTQSDGCDPLGQVLSSNALDVEVALLDVASSEFFVLSSVGAARQKSGVVPFPNDLSLSMVSRLVASNGEPSDYFGFSLDFDLEGRTLVVGAPYESSLGNDPESNLLLNAGAVYVFTRSGSDWDEVAMLKAPSPTSTENFGMSVSIASDASRIAVGAPYGTGSVYVYKRDEGQSWVFEKTLTSPHPGTLDNFGASVDIGAGSVLAVGVPGESSDGSSQVDTSASRAGAVYVFRHNMVTGWEEEAYLKHSFPKAGDTFGGSVQFDETGSILIVSTPFDNNGSSGINGDESSEDLESSGSVSVYRNDGAWVKEAFLRSANPTASAGFGYSISMAGDTLLVGARNENIVGRGVGADVHGPVQLSSRFGGAYLFERSLGLGGWSQTNYIKAEEPSVGDVFGVGTLLSVSGDVMYISAVGEDSSALGLNGEQLNDEALNTGAVYRYRKVGDDWIFDAFIKSPELLSGAVNFGDYSGIATNYDGKVLAVSDYMSSQVFVY
ncbi:Ig-like domain-containing protein [Vibrio sp. PNB22_3_1]